MTFKEKLIEKAEQINIQKEMDYIKQDMEEHFSRRNYEIRLYKSHCSLAVGGKGGFNTNHSDFFVPDKLSGKGYGNLFIKELKKLGFNDVDISVEEHKYKGFDLYTITVRW